MRKLFKTGVPTLLLLTLVVSGCSFGSNKAMQEMDTPQINYVDEGEALDEETELIGSEEQPIEEQAETEEGPVETVTRELYLIDQNGMVVSKTFDLPKTQGVLRQSLEYLVDGGPVSNLLPSGFQAVLPAGTEVDVHFKEDERTAVADFSEEFKSYNPEQELQILQSITWTLTQFENVDKVQIRINGYDQETMPVGNTPIGEGYSRANGINLEKSEVADVVNSKGVTLYFLAQNGDNTYYVPVTRRVKNTDDSIKEVVNQLLAGPSIYSNLLTDIRNGAELLDSPKYENGVVTLNFNEAILNQMENTAISDEVLNLIVLSLTEQPGVEKVAIEVNGEAKVLKVSGEPLTEPVSRPVNVNTGKF
ncbi:GerMN domain-containing protein [Alkalihalobacterium chitinilyticum]|uniref:GerMN domain-containing protein n=1 Tax=Alkalihalobacterium chitinilyticum TaxID=2980103 RepID=A0ABT5VAU4_9BACI|nr:GerMN domain-containing protein [Alkalihalobacterium chitinilyticum]MDE5412395.1 GerMN domain-containing protein [Alkalihalobacterium chitinilyticum]